MRPETVLGSGERNACNRRPPGPARPPAAGNRELGAGGSRRRRSREPAPLPRRHAALAGADPGLQAARPRPARDVSTASCAGSAASPAPFATSTSWSTISAACSTSSGDDRAGAESIIADAREGTRRAAGDPRRGARHRPLQAAARPVRRGSARRCASMDAGVSLVAIAPTRVRAAPGGLRRARPRTRATTTSTPFGSGPSMLATPPSSRRSATARS